MQASRVHERIPSPADATAGQPAEAASGAERPQLRGLDFAAGERLLTPKVPAPGAAAGRPMAMAEVQTRLNALGYDCGGVDGKIGVKTRAAIKAFQGAHGLEADGIVGTATADALRNAGRANTEAAANAQGALGAGDVNAALVPAGGNATAVSLNVNVSDVVTATTKTTNPGVVNPAGVGGASVGAPATSQVNVGVATVAPQVDAVAGASASEVKPEVAAAAPEAAPKLEAEAAKPDAPAWMADPTMVLDVKEIIKLSYADCLSYLDTRPRDHVESLGKDAKFIGYAIGFDVEKTAQLAVRIILRTPDAVIEKGASRAEAIRILTSQLRDKGVIRRLLSAEVRVVIVPANKLLTDLPEFAQQKGTYTFDGRPWDTVRGLGGKHTAITEENLLGVTDMDASIGRKGWGSQAAMDQALQSGNTAPNEAGKAGPTDSDAVMNNPGVYCEGYSTTNHEFFHTIHMFGLSRQDNQLIDREYAAKKAMPRVTPWADGPRLMPDGTTESENYASSTVYEYFAQTGCAFQGTNLGTDPYTGHTRNNGRSWVTTHEPGLAALYARICSDSALLNVNPTTARKAADEKKKAASAPQPAPMTGATPASAPPPPGAVTTAMGFIQEK